jgi:hypothetical protein
MVSSFGGSPRRIVAARGEQLARQAPGIAREFFFGPDLSKYWEQGGYGWGTPSLARKVFELKGLRVKYSGIMTYLGDSEAGWYEERRAELRRRFAIRDSCASFQVDSAWV